MKWQFDVEDGAVAELAFYVDVATVGADELARNGQAQATARAIAVGAGAIGAPEAVEDEGQRLG